MTKKEVKRIFKELDNAKFSLFHQEGIVFDFSLLDMQTGDVKHSGIAPAEIMTEMILHNLCDAYLAVSDKDEVTIEDFAESVKYNLIRYYENYETEGEVITY